MSLSHCHLISTLDILEAGKAAGTEIPLSPVLCSSCPLSPASLNSPGWCQCEAVDNPVRQDETPGRPSALGPPAWGSAPGLSGVLSSAQGFSIPSHST